MAIIKFELGVNELQFSQNISLPVSRPIEKVQAIDRDASGGLHVETLGPAMNRRVLDFKAMPKVDYDLLKNWFDNIADGATNPFTFIDERSETLLVVIISKVLDFPEFYEGWHRGQIMLEVVG